MDKIIYQSLYREQEFELVANLKNININVTELKRLLNDYNNICEHLEVNKYNQNQFTYENVKTLLYCIEKSIYTCGLTECQLERLELWLDGFTEVEIAHMMNVSTPTVHKSLKKSCLKVSEKLGDVIRYVFR